MELLEEIMSKVLQTVSVNTVLSEANKVMNESSVRHLIIENENGTIAGILSDRDIKRFISPFATSDGATKKTGPH